MNIEHNLIEWLRRPAYHNRTNRIYLELTLRADPVIDFGFDPDTDVSALETELKDLERIDKAFFLKYGHGRVSSQSMTKIEIDRVLKCASRFERVRTPMQQKTYLAQVNRELKALGYAEIV
jgi:hypothetical protein